MRVGLLPGDMSLLFERDVNSIHSGTISRGGCGLHGQIPDREGEKKKEVPVCLKPACQSGYFVGLNDL